MLNVEFKSNDRSFVEILLTNYDFPLFLLCLEKNLIQRRNMGGMHKAKRHDYFSLPASRKEIFYNLHEEFFFLKVCAYGYQNVLYRQKVQKMKFTFSHSHLSILRCQQCFHLL